MKINGKNFRTIWPHSTGKYVEIIDQTLLPHQLEIGRIDSLKAMITAIKTMQVRGAPLIGAAAAYGMALTTLEDASNEGLAKAAADLLASRPTAVNLRWAVERMLAHLRPLATPARPAAAWAEAAAICDEDVEINQAIGQHGLKLIEVQMELQKRAPLTQFNILTHCNAGWLATVDWGTALAPIYAAHDAGLAVHVWVDETRPRNQGASLTAWELGQHGVPHTVITDNAGGHLMQHGKVDLVLVGADRVTSAGDVCNKIGSYLKALAAFDNQVPFYVAVPSPTIDWTITDGLSEIPIEERDADEVALVTGRLADGKLATVNILPQGSAAANPAFDVTPARLVTGIITERGVCAPGQLGTLFPEKNGGKKIMQAQREKLLEIARKLSTTGLNQGTAGNVSVRSSEGFLITPSGVKTEEMTPHDMVWMDFEGKSQGEREPSSEWRFHRDILRARPEVGAVVHTHSMFATTLSCLRKDIPPFHYMIALVGGASIRCAPYALFGTQALSDNALQALQERKACLLANHGMIALGDDLDEALDMTVEVENLCEQYWRALQLGEPYLLTAQEMAEVFERFKSYGRWAKPD